MTGWDRLIERAHTLVTTPHAVAILDGLDRGLPPQEAAPRGSASEIGQALRLLAELHLVDVDPDRTCPHARVALTGRGERVVAILHNRDLD